jgi:hypothetical protein
MREQQEITAELQRVAKLLASNRVSKSDYDKHGRMSVSGICYIFGSWNRAIVAAGLEPFKKGREAAYVTLGFPDLSESDSETAQK